MVTCIVCGITSTENVSPSTLLTVKETPSSATEPFSAINRDSPIGARKVNEALSRKSSRDDEFGNPVNMATDQMSSELVTKPKRAFQVDARAAPPIAGSCQPQRFGRGIDGEERSTAHSAALHNRKANSRTGD